MAQLFSHVCEDAMAVVYSPVRHRQRVNSGRAGAAEDLQLEFKRQARVRVDRSRASIGSASIRCGHLEAGALELHLSVRVAERLDALLLAVVALPQIASANPLRHLAGVD